MVGVRVWWARLALLPPWYAEVMTEVERARHDRMVRTADRRRFAMGCVLLRVVAGRSLGSAPEALVVDRTCGGCGQPHGRPTLAGHPDLRVSLSHSGERVVLALAGGVEVGVDVERVRPHGDLERMAGKFLSPAERDAWSAVPPPLREEAFATYWTRKEAVVKATGDGLSTPIGRVEVSPPGSPPALTAWQGREPLVARTTLHALDAGPGYVAHLAVMDAAGTPVSVMGAAGMPVTESWVTMRLREAR